ncbi:MAG: gamma-glutamylcyclotransferase [Janthinobacterium lividum]
MLTRLALTSGAYLSTLEGLPRELRWSEADIARSLAAMLSGQKEDADVWIFGYGSLIWNPLTDHAERHPAVLDGWHRSFCQRLTVGRAAAHAPGRMLGLRCGGGTDGVVYRLAAATREEELRLIWIREMAMGTYRPIWAPVRLADGTLVRAIVFVADPDHPHYECDSEIETVAPLIAEARGPWGSNAEYVFKLAAALEHHKMRDVYIIELAARIRQCLLRHRQRAGRSAALVRGASAY